MKVPLGWLGELVRLPGSTELAEKLTLAGLEVGSARAFGAPPPAGLRLEDTAPPWDADKVMVCRVIRVDPHPDAEKLKLPVVDIGAGIEKMVVTGAPNLQVGDSGQLCIIALTGANLYDGHSETKVIKTLAPTKIRGILSDAMLCSAYELGLTEDHDGLLFLDQDEAEPGTPAVQALGDVVLDIDILPNMARCLSLVGIAREVSALTGASLCLPISNPPTDGPPLASVEVALADPALCTRYRAIVLDGVHVGPSPGWMRRRLASAGMRPISNVVDITNYVMIEQGQPLHAFDFDKLQARASGKPVRIEVRPATPGETMRTLDGQDRSLEPGLLVIADTAGPIALAGVMGGADTEVGPSTTRVLLEGACFDPVAIRRSARAYQLHSEASQRFTRGVPAELASLALDRAAELLIRYAGAVLRSGVAEAWPTRIPIRTVRLEYQAVARLLGAAPPMERVGEILRALDFKLKPLQDGEPGFHVEIPWHRLDIQDGVADLVEDIARLWGHENIPASLPSGEVQAPVEQPDLALEDRVRDMLAGLGSREMISHALTSPEREEAFLQISDRGPAVTLANPISPDRCQLRRSLLGGVVEAARLNVRHTPTIRLFEIGTAFLHQGGRSLFPREERRVALVLAGRRTESHWDDKTKSVALDLDFYDLKGLLESLLEGLGIGVGRFNQPAHIVPFLHPGRQAVLSSLGGEYLGLLGEIHPRLARSLEIVSPRIMVAELLLEPLRAAAREIPLVKPVARFPAALRDIAVLVEESLPAIELEQAIRESGTGLISACRIFDLFTGAGIPPGKKSIALALGYQAADRTLGDKEIDLAHRKVEEHLRKKFGAHIRGKDDVPGK